MPSHEKLYLLASDSSYRVITGSANLSLAALSGRHKEVFIVFDGETAYRAFEEYYRRDAGEAAAVPADCLIVPAANGDPPQSRTAPIQINSKCPAFRCCRQKSRLSRIGPRRYRPD